MEIKSCESCVVNGRVSITCKYCKSNGYAYHEPNPALGKQGERIIDISLTEDGFARCPTCGVLNMEQGRSKEHCEHYVRTGKDVRGSWITFKFQPAPTDARAKVTFDPSQEQPSIVTNGLYDTALDEILSLRRKLESLEADFRINRVKRAAGWVQLSKNQEAPINEMCGAPNDDWEQAQKVMLTPDANGEAFRRVRVEK